MDLAARRPFPDLPLGRILLFAALLLAGVALALIAAGSRPKLPPPFGLAGNGIQLVSLDGHIYAVDRLGGDQRQLIQDSAWDFAATYSRDGSKILFLSAPASPGDATPVSLESANSDGTGIRDLTGPIVGLDGFQWSPDGTQVGLLSHDSNGQGHIQVVSSSGGTVRTLDVHMSVSDATWRPPDGSEIVFRGQGDHPAIFAVRPDGSGLRQLTHQAGVDAFDYMNPALSPDGKTVSFGRYLGEATGVRLFLLDVSTGAERPLGMPSDGQSQQGPVVFSPDGRSVAYTLLEQGATYQVAVVPLDGSSAGTRLGPSLERNHGDFSVDVSFVPDGSAVVAVYSGSAKDTVWWLPVDGSRGTQLAYGSFDSVDVQRRAP